MPALRKAKGHCDLGGSVALHETLSSKKGSTMNIATTEPKINRRRLFAALPAFAATATGVMAYQMPDAPVQDDPLPEWWRDLSRKSASEQIQTYAKEIRRLMAETAPEDMPTIGEAIIFKNGKLMGHAFPDGYDHGDKFAVFQNGCWAEAV